MHLAGSLLAPAEVKPKEKDEDCEED